MNDRCVRCTEVGSRSLKLASGDKKDGAPCGWGWAAGIGRIGTICGPILGGMLLGAGLEVPWGFYAFAGVGLVGCVFIAAGPRSPAEALRETSPSPEGAAQ